MWINCLSDSIKNIKVVYCISNDSFCIKSDYDNADIEIGAELFAYFYDEDSFKNFSVGKYSDDGKSMVLDKQYSVSYMNSIGILPDKFSHFKIIEPNGKITNIFPDITGNGIYTDRAIINAKETLASLKSDCSCYDVNIVVDNICDNLKKYMQLDLPFLNSFNWYVIDDYTEYFGLTSVKHLTDSPGFNCYSNLWYFGADDKKRIYAVAVKGESNIMNPLSNADDCTVIYRGENNDVCYYVVGIILLDDGQYFCRLE